jgi:nucleosome binding factor SPN SPT16 subunit
MAEEVKIDKQLFFERLGQFISAWKTDKRTDNALFGGVSSIVVLLGKSEDAGYQKNNAFHVSFCYGKSLEELEAYRSDRFGC